MKRFGMARRVLAIALALTLACAGIAALAKMVTCPACGGSGGTFCSSCGGTGQRERNSQKNGLSFTGSKPGISLMRSAR